MKITYIQLTTKCTNHFAIFGKIRKAKITKKIALKMIEQRCKSTLNNDKTEMTLIIKTKSENS